MQLAWLAEVSEGVGVDPESTDERPADGESLEGEIPPFPDEPPHFFSGVNFLMLPESITTSFVT